MTTATTTDRLDITVQAVAAATATLDAARSERDAAIRAARATGVSAFDLAARTGLSIQMIYKILA